jgi:phosphomannomutase
MGTIADIFKAYDIRGLYPEEIQPEVAYKIGRALVTYLKAGQVAVGRDMRVSSPALAGAIIDGIIDQGADVIDIGEVSTDTLYFTVGRFGYDAGVMVTASHNPAAYNGFKICGTEARPLSLDHGIGEIRDMVINKVAFKEPSTQGAVQTKDVLSAFADHVLSFINPEVIRPLKVAIDAGNGMGGKIVPAVFDRLPIEVIPLYFELDGRFPNHVPNPLEPENIVDLRNAVLSQGADLGIAFDGDADRMFILDEHGNFVGGDMITALVSKSLLRQHPGATIVYNLICSRVVPETIEREGGKAIRSRVGHSFIKARMREYDAIFGGEHSGHFYFRDNWYADSGMIAALTVLQLLSEEGLSVSEALKPLDHYYRSGELNTAVSDQAAVLKNLEKRFAGGRIDHLDGLTVNYPNWWFNARPSNTQPLLRLNVEADSPDLLEKKTEELLTVIRWEG